MVDQILRQVPHLSGQFQHLNDVSQFSLISTMRGVRTHYISNLLVFQSLHLY